MNIEQINITRNIHLLIFDNQIEIASTLLRFEEHYESPEFRGKIFSLKDYKDWYIANSPRGKKTGKFTYYTDWDGFNIPSYVLKPFFEGKFNPLSIKEKKVLDMFKNTNEPYYIIAIHREMYELSLLLRHEVAHGLFYTDKNYKKEVLNVLSMFDKEKILKGIRINFAGYHQAVMDDEIHAYSLTSNKRVKTKYEERLKMMLEDVYKDYLMKNSAKIPTLIEIKNSHPIKDHDCIR